MIYLKNINILKQKSLPAHFQLESNLHCMAFWLQKLTVAIQIIEDALRNDSINPKQTILLDTSSGTLAYALALVGKSYRFHVKLVSDPAIDANLANLLDLLDASIEIVQHPINNSYQIPRLKKVYEIMMNEPCAFFTRQYDNPSNAKSYQDAIVNHIHASVPRIDVLVCCTGSGGSITGLSTLRKFNPNMKVVAVDTHGSVLWGEQDAHRTLRGLGNSLIPRALNHKVCDEVFWVPAAEAFFGARALFQNYTIDMGATTGAAYVVARHIAAMNPDKQVVFIGPDRAERYLSTIYKENWCRQNNAWTTDFPDDVYNASSPADAQQHGGVAKFAWNRRSLAQVVPDLAEKLKNTTQIMDSFDENRFQSNLSNAGNKHEIISVLHDEKANYKTNKQQAIIFIGSNTSGSGGEFLNQCSSDGFTPILLHRATDRIAMFNNIPNVVFQMADIDNDCCVNEAIEKLSQQYDIAGITSSSEYSVAMAARQAKKRGLPGPNPQAVQLCRNKIQQRKALEQAGVDQPRFFAATTLDQAFDAAKQLNLENGVILKPAQGSGSVGVYMVKTVQELGVCASQLLAQQHNERGQKLPGEILLEEVIIGDEFSVELFNGQVIGITRKYLSQPPRFLEIGHDFPAAGIGEATRSCLESTATAAVKALGLTFGPIHAELRVHNNRAYIIEVNPRLAGGSLPILFKACGHDLIGQTLAAVTDNKFTLQKTNPSYRYASIRYIRTPRNGIFKGFENIENCINRPDVQIMNYYNPGDAVEVTGDFRERTGHVIVFGNSPQQTVISADALVKEISPVIQ